MPSVIKPKKSNVASAVPTTLSLADGEMAVNTSDKKLYVREGTEIIEVANASGGGGGSGTTVIIVSSNLTLNNSHLNALLEKTSTAALTMTIPPNYGNPGDAIMFVNSGTSGNLTLARGTGVSLWTYGTNANLVIPQRRAALIVRATAANTWIRA